MKFLIADTFTDSLARLAGDEQKAVKTTAFDLQLNPASPGMKFHKLDRAKDKNFWSVRVNDDIGLIVHKVPDSLLLCYVDHHNKAYDWAARRRLQTHPKTGAAQLVEIRETFKEVTVPIFVGADSPRPASANKPLFAHISDDVLLGYGVPTDWLGDVRTATDDSLLALADRLPAEAAEALLELATGGKPRVTQPANAAASPFDHPDALRRFRVMANVEELQRALDFPWEKWTVFLHPEQRQWIERDYNGPARVSGSAGTGKTIVALHRAVHLARTRPEARVLLTTFSHVLANALKARLNCLIGNQSCLADRIEVCSLDEIGLRLHEAQIGKANLASSETVVALLKDASQAAKGHKFHLAFLLMEWEQLVDAWQLQTWDEYRDVARVGRKTRLSEAQRAVLWSIFERVATGLKAREEMTFAGLFGALASSLALSKKGPFDFEVVDEAQDITIAHLRFLAAIGGGPPNALFFAGDLGQRIFQQPFSWKALGVDVRGRSRTLRGPEVSDIDGNNEKRSDTVSVFNGPAPAIRKLKTDSAEINTVGAWLTDQAKAGVRPDEIGLFVRSAAEVDRAVAAANRADMPFRILDEQVETAGGHVSIGTMHLAKGLEFRAVAVMACDDEVIPSQERIETVGDDADLQEIYDTERHLLYVACTRARDHLLVTGVEPTSEFLDDLIV